MIIRTFTDRTFHDHKMTLASFRQLATMIRHDILRGELMVHDVECRLTSLPIREIDADATLLLAEGTK